MKLKLIVHNFLNFHKVDFYLISIEYLKNFYRKKEIIKNKFIFGFDPKFLVNYRFPKSIIEKFKNYFPFTMIKKTITFTSLFKFFSNINKEVIDEILPTTLSPTTSILPLFWTKKINKINYPSLLFFYLIRKRADCWTYPSLNIILLKYTQAKSYAIVFNFLIWIFYEIPLFSFKIKRKNEV